MAEALIFCPKCKGFNIRYIEERLTIYALWCECKDCKHQFQVGVN